MKTRKIALLLAAILAMNSSLMPVSAFAEENAVVEYEDTEESFENDLSGLDAFTDDFSVDLPEEEEFFEIDAVTDGSFYESGQFSDAGSSEGDFVEVGEPEEEFSQEEGSEYASEEDETDLDELIENEELLSLAEEAPDDELAGMPAELFNPTGIWEGTYVETGGGSDSSLSIKLIVQVCFDDDSFFGVATIDQGEHGIYEFDGCLDPESNEISFEGSDWIYNPSGFSLSEFTGTYMDSYISGIVGGKANRTFFLNKVSDDPSSEKIATKDIIRDWTGEYDGSHGEVVVRRNYELHITEVDENGSISGTAVFSPSEKAESKYGANGSYYFSGEIDFLSGHINLQGDKWIEYPVNYENFRFVELNGFIDCEAGVIKGNSEHGIWNMSQMTFDEYDISSGFTLGRDNNSFAHSGNAGRSEAGFVGVTDYTIDENHFNRLTSNASASEKNRIKKEMHDPWAGSCYGIAATMGLVFENKLRVSDISSGGASDYYHMSYPCNDAELLNTINYYQLSQWLDNGGKQSSAISTTYNKSLIENLTSWQKDYDSLPVFLQKLVNNTMNHHVMMFGYSTKQSGHAILVTGCHFNQSAKEYEIQLYDENCIRSPGAAGSFLTMKVAKDFSSFSFADANGKTLNDSTYRTMYILDWNAMSSLYDQKNEAALEHTKLAFPADQPIHVQNENGKDLTYDGNCFSGTIPVYGFETIDTDGGSQFLIEVDGSERFTILPSQTGMDIAIFDDDDYMALSGSNISEVDFNLGESIGIQGNSVTFDAYVTTEEMVADNEKDLFYLSGDGNSSIQLKVDDTDIVVSSEESIGTMKIASMEGCRVEEKEITASSDEITVNKELINSDISDLGGISLDKENFPDDNFRKVISNYYDLDSDGLLSDEEISRIVNLYVRCEGIIDLTGIEYLTEIETLDCSENELEELDIGSLYRLETLDCSNNKISQLDLQYNEALKNLQCDCNELESLDLSWNYDLENVSCDWNYITSLDLSGLSDLNCVSCAWNKITNLIISDETRMQKLICNDNQLTSIDLSDQTELTELNCNNNKLALLSVVDCEKLEKLNCTLNELSTLVVKYCPELVELCCAANKLTRIDLTKNKKLKYFDCCENNFSSLDLSNNTELLEFNCSKNALTALTIDHNPKLREVYCDENKISTLDLSANPELQYLTCGCNSLSALDLSANPELQYLSCESNSLSTLDLSANPELKYLSCGDNSFNTLNLSANSKLKEVSCIGNQLSELELKNNPNISDLSCYNNKITELDITNCEKLLTAYQDGDKSVDDNFIAYEFITKYDGDGEPESIFSSLFIDKTTRVIDKVHVHTKVTIPSKAATCTAAGLTAGAKCSECGKILTAQKTIPILGHSYSAWKVTKPATSTQTGTEVRSCTRCGKQETRSIAKLSKQANTMTVTAKGTKVKASRLSRKKYSIAETKVFTVNGAQGPVTFAKVSGSKALAIDKNGKITVAKGTKKGKYKINAAVTAAGNDMYESKTVNVTVKIKVV